MRSLVELMKLSVGKSTTDEEEKERCRLEHAVIEARKVVDKSITTSDLVFIISTAIDAYNTSSGVIYG